MFRGVVEEGAHPRGTDKQLREKGESESAPKNQRVCVGRKTYSRHMPPRYSGHMPIPYL